MNNTIIKVLLLCAELLPKVIIEGEKLKTEIGHDSSVEAKVTDALGALLDVVTDAIKTIPESGAGK